MQVLTLQLSLGTPQLVQVLSNDPLPLQTCSVNAQLAHWMVSAHILAEHPPRSKSSLWLRQMARESPHQCRCL